MTPRQVSIVGIADHDRAAQAVLIGSPATPTEPESIALLLAAVAAIESGESTAASIGPFTLKERSAAIAAGDTCFALIASRAEEGSNAERFANVAIAALSLYYRFLPTRRPWLSSYKRQAFVPPGLLLCEPDQPVARPLTTLAQRSLQLITLSADTPEALAAQLEDLRAAPTPLKQLAANSHASQRADHRLGLALIAATPADLLREIELARVGIPRAVAAPGEWKTPGGSYFSAKPLGPGGVAFVYPGVGSPYPGVGADLFGFAPALMDRFDALTRGESFRYLHAQEIYTRESALTTGVVGLGECAISISAILTMLFRDVFGVQPRSAFGYSFGEAIMPASLGVWPDPVALAARLDGSQVFRTRLQGPMDAIRQHWSMPEGQALHWKSFTVRATPARLFEALRMERRVYLSIINSPEEVVIAGDEGACGRVISMLGSPHISMPIAMTMHCPPSRSEYAELVRIHTLPSNPQPSVALFSVSGYQPIAQDSASLAHAVADGYTKAVDFPRLIRRAYADGARIFLELGGRRNCSTWIEKTLHGRPHAAIPCDSQGLAGDAAILRALARLFSHRVPLSFSCGQQHKERSGEHPTASCLAG